MEAGFPHNQHHPTLLGSMVKDSCKECNSIVLIKSGCFGGALHHFCTTSVLLPKIMRFALLSIYQTDELKMVFIKAQAGPANIGDPEGLFTVQYLDEKGNMTIRNNGSRAWRCNNPGNLRKSSYSIGKDRRAIGFAGAKNDWYAVYPDYETGHEALIVMLKGSKYSPLSLRAAIKRYDEYNPLYIDSIVGITGLDPDRTVGSLSPKEFELFWKAIEQVEDWKIGREDFIEKWYISGVHKKRGVITEYLVANDTESVWMSKEKAIELAETQKLHAILVHLKSGSNYLRPEYGVDRFTLVS